MSKLLVVFIILLSFYGTKSDETEEEIDTRSDDIVILHTNDVHCGVQDSIGYDGLMLYKKQLLKKYKYVFTVDSGDHIQGGILGTLTQGEFIIDIMNEVGYDVAILGNHEFDYGVEQMHVCADRLNCSYISSNFVFRKNKTDNKTSIFPGYKILEAGNKKVAFIGVTTPQALTKSSLMGIKDEKGDLLYDFLTDRDGQELSERVQSIINDVISQNADYVIILAHLGKDGDALEQYRSIGLLKNLEGVDAVLDGHSHQVYSTMAPDKNDKNATILAQTGTKLNNLGVLTINVNNDTMNHQLLSSIPIIDKTYDNSTYLNVTRNKMWTYVDKEMYDFINSILNQTQDLLDDLVGYAPFPLYLNSDPNDKNSPQISRYKESTLCNLVADAIREAGDADICLINAGSVRVNLDEGNITYKEILNLMPFSNDINVINIRGQDVLDALEWGVKELPGITSRFPQVSGLTYRIDTTINSSVVTDSSEAFSRVTGKRRVYDVRVGGEELDPEKNYSMALSSFLVQGGDGYSMLLKCEVLKDSLGVDNEVLTSLFS